MTSKSLPKITISLLDILKGKDLLGHKPGDRRITKIAKMTPVINSNQLVINSLSYGNKLYAITMSIFGVSYSDTRSNEYPLTVSLGNGDYKYAKQLKISDTKAQVRCTCPDFYYTWSYWDKQNRVLSGPSMPKYIRKTTTYPERNHLHIPGACKHIIALTNRLKQLKILKD